MEIRRMNAARGWIWIRQGFQLIVRNPLMSVSFALIGALGLFFALRIPPIGPLLAVALIPALMAGYMRVCRALEEDEAAELTHLFEGFRKHAKGLFTLGGIAVLGLLLTSIVMVIIGGKELTTLLESFRTASDPQVMMNAMQAAGSGVAFTLLLGFALVCALMLALQYAPMLVFFNEMKPVAAMRASLAGSLRNIIPYVIYNVILQIIAVILSILPYDIGLLVLLPLGLTSLYVSYRNIFPFAHELAAMDPVPNNPEA